MRARRVAAGRGPEESRQETKQRGGSATLNSISPGLEGKSPGNIGGETSWELLLDLKY